mgnify:CR=1 FL=1
MCARERKTLCKGVGLHAQPNSGFTLPAAYAVSNIKLSDKTFTYSIAKGAIVDVSLTGTLAWPYRYADWAVNGCPLARTIDRSVTWQTTTRGTPSNY